MSEHFVSSAPLMKVSVIQCFLSFKEATLFHTLIYYTEQQQLFDVLDLWMDYIKEELARHGNPENCGKLHWRAVKTLEGESVERFTTKYTLLQTGNI